MIEVQVRGAAGAFRLDVEFAVPEGGVTALFGPSGSGKTTLINMIAGLLRPEAGRIVVNGAPVFDSQAGVDIAPHRRRIGTIFQEGRLFPHLTVRANLVYGMNRTPPAQRYVGLDQVVDMLGIGDLLTRRPATLSGGEKQRVAIGRALLASPRLLLMDEPLAALDAARKAEILPFIERLHRDIQVPVIYVSHAMDEVLAIADTMALMAEGRVVAVGPVEEVASRADLYGAAGRPGFGHAETVIAATVAEHEPEFGLTRLAAPAGALRVPRLDRAVGSMVRLRIRARDVSLALSRPSDISVLNIFPGTIEGIDDHGNGTVDVTLDIGPGPQLHAQITARAVHDLALGPGARVFALVKSVAIDRYSPAPASEPSGGGT
jgi:molybdate transport system ATP-binding protein